MLHTSRSENTAYETAEKVLNAKHRRKMEITSAFVKRKTCFRLFCFYLCGMHIVFLLDNNSTDQFWL